MFQLVFYEDSNGDSPVYDLISSLDQSDSKDAKIQLKQIMFQLDILQRLGTRAPKNYVEHIWGDIWQVRAGKNRIFFFFWKDDHFVLLHSFVKKTQQTPASEKKQAERERIDWINRHGK